MQPTSTHLQLHGSEEPIVLVVESLLERWAAAHAPRVTSKPETWLQDQGKVTSMLLAPGFVKNEAHGRTKSCRAYAT